MILYHGTSYQRGIKILESGCLKSNIERFYDQNCDFPTTNGYVYLTNHIFKAIHWGNITASIEQDTKLMLFQVDVQEELLEPDYDELKYTLPFNPDSKMTFMDSLRLVYSVRVAQDIMLKQHRGKYAEMISTHCPGNELSKLTREAARLYKEPYINNEYVSDFAKVALRKLENVLEWKEIV